MHKRKSILLNSLDTENESHSINIKNLSPSIDPRYSNRLLPNTKSPSSHGMLRGYNPSNEYSDRFIPNRASSLIDPSRVPLESYLFSDAITCESKSSSSTVQEARNEANLLKKQFNSSLPIEGNFLTIATPTIITNPDPSSPNKLFLPDVNSRTLRYRSPVKTPSPLRAHSQLMANPRSPSVEIKSSPSSLSISKYPYKILDAPGLRDDFYLNVLDWSSQNVIVVGLSSSVFLYHVNSCKADELCNLDEDNIASVSWNEDGTRLAIGTESGLIHIYDPIQKSRIATIPGHSRRVVVLAWNSSLLASGSRDHIILLRDMRDSHETATRYSAHKQEVCGLKWSYDGVHFASGGNDNKLFIWDVSYSLAPVLRLEDHKAAVKAIAWSPHEEGLIASGSGTADRKIRIYNIGTGECLNCIESGSQVCNLLWAKNTNKIVSSHGYSLNQIILWRYPNMKKIITLSGHSFRVLYMCGSPDGNTIITAAADETIRFWNLLSVFSTGSNRIGSKFYGPVNEGIR